MKKIKVMSIFGTRPEATKMLPLHLEMLKHEQLDPIICVTAQHRELLDQVLQPFDITPEYDLNIMSAGQTSAQITSRVITSLGEILQQARPDLILVHGDTTTTFAASLTAFYAKIQLAHVEAGLRTYDKYQPYPEEMNRKLTTALADIHFAPTWDAHAKLLKENVPAESIFVTGNTAIDFMGYTVNADHKFTCGELNTIPNDKRLILMTAHRNENWGEPMENICRAVQEILDTHQDTFLIWPIHPNPKVKDVGRKFLGDHPRVLLTAPICVHDLHNIMARCHLVLTDSGGLQEEAPTLNKPVIVLREVTERPEGLTAGTLILAGTETADIVTAATDLLTDTEKYNKMANAPNPFGDGQAAQRIVQYVLHKFNLAGCPSPL